MKKILLLLSLLILSFSSIIAATASGNLNPFAYDLSATVDQAAMTLTVNYSLNAPATSVVVEILNGNTVVKTINCGLQGKKEGYSKTIDISGLVPGISYTWRVVVKGETVTTPVCVKNDVRFYAPTSVDIDNNPMNDNFGTVFVVEGRPDGNGNTTFQSGKNAHDGAGLYILNADGTPREIPGAPGRYGYNGSRVEQFRQYFYGKNDDKYSGYSPYRVRVSDDGRVFITTLNPPLDLTTPITLTGSITINKLQEVLWEADPKRFSSKTYVGARGDWQQVMCNVNPNSYLRETQWSCGDGIHDFCGVHNLYTSDNKFIAGPNIGFDVRGSGENLKLLMLSACRQGIAIYTPSHFYCYEYNLGTKTVWDEPASKKIFTGHSKGVNIFKYDGTQVQYDKDGNVWVCSYTSIPDGKPTTFAKVKGDGSGEYTMIDASTTLNRRCGGLRFSNDFKHLVVASNETGSGGGFTLYEVKQDGSITKIDGYKTYDYTGYSIMDFAWDYANNLYIAADGQQTTGQRIAVYKMPYSGTATTPAKESFAIECDPNVYYTITANSDNSEYGSVAISSNPAMVEGKVQSCAKVTVTATPNEHYRFVEWRAGGTSVSINATYSFYATRDIALTAHFAYAKHNVTWNNLFMNGKDIGTENPHFPGINERLWRMFQARYRFHGQPDLKTGNAYANQAEYNLDDRLYVRTDGLLFVDINDDEAVKKSKAIQNFLTNDSEFRWLKEYILSNNSQQIGTDKAFVYHLFGFFNRTNKIYYNSTTAITNYTFAGNYEELGKPENWAPIWTETVLGLPQTMEYGDYTPIDWVHEEDYNKCPFRGRWVSGWHTNTDNNEAIIQRPDAWYISYKVQNIGEPLTSLLPILAWRNGSTTGEIVTTITGNMDLYATYVDKNIDEYDVVPANPANYDATNNDVIKLLQNRNYTGSHDVTISRQLQGGMYNTICLPFDVDLTSLANNHPFKGAKAMEFTGVSSLYNESNEPVTVLQFTEVTRLMKGIPYLIQTQSDVVGKTSFSGITYNTITPDVQQVTPNESPFTFHGSVNPTEVPEGSLIVVANNRLALTTEDGEMAGMRGYFSIDPVYASEIAEQAANGRVYLKFQKPTTTSIPVAPEAEQSTKPNVEKLILDGHLYILRDKEMYTITGCRVR